jgi:hypothetical protein
VDINIKQFVMIKKLCISKLLMLQRCTNLPSIQQKSHGLICTTHSSQILKLVRVFAQAFQHLIFKTSAIVPKKIENPKMSLCKLANIFYPTFVV